MPFLSNRYIFTGLAISLLTVISAISGAPLGFEEFTIPIWNILLQFNLCTGLVFLVLGVLQVMEISTPDLRPALQLFSAAFVAYGMGYVFYSSPLAIPPSIKLFLFAFSLACIAAGWARLVFSVLKQFDTDADTQK